MTTLKNILFAVLLLTGLTNVGFSKDEVLYKGIEYKCKNYKSGKIKEKTGLSRSALIKKARKRCGKSELKSFHVIGYMGVFKKDLYEVLNYTCQDFNKVFVESDPKCKTKVEWKAIAKKRCAKISLMPRLVTSYKVKKQCKIRSLKKSSGDASEFSNSTSK